MRPPKVPAPVLLTARCNARRTPARRHFSAPATISRRPRAHAAGRRLKYCAPPGASWPRVFRAPALLQLPAARTNCSSDTPAAIMNGNGAANDVFVGAIDQGTTSSRFLIFNPSGELVASHQVEFTQYFPNSGWHEHDPLEIVSSVEVCIEEGVKAFEEKGYNRSQIASVGITNQRETTVVWDRNTGEPLYNAIVWTDTRAQALVRELKARPGADKLLQVCGLPLSTYPSSAKLLWLLDNVPEVKAAYDEGKLAFGTVDTWLVFKLNGGLAKNVFVTDATNASRTMFMNISTLRYDDALLDFFQLTVGKVHLPKIVDSADAKAYGTLSSGALAGTVIAGCLGDQSAALVGQKGFSPGLAKNTYGTGCFLLYNVGDKPVISKHGLLATIAYVFNGKPVYALEGSIAVAGSGVKFLQNNLGLFEKAQEINELAAATPDNGGVVFVTAFSGLFAPYWIDDAKGTMFGITLNTTKGHIARATLEATCYQTKAILDAMQLDSGHALAELAVDGGMSNSDLCMQTQADTIGIPVYRPRMRETTALGAAIAAGLAVGVWRSFAELRDVNRAGGTVFRPKTTAEQRDVNFAIWSKAVDKCRGWVDVPGKKQDAAVAAAPAASKAPASDFRKRVDSGTAMSNDDLTGMDEEDLQMELRKIEIIQTLKKLKAHRTKL